MRVLLITISYPPEIGGAAHLIHELALGMKKRGHEVIVLTNYPSYNLKVVPFRYRRGFRMIENWEGIPVRRIRIPLLPRNQRIARGVQHFMYGIWLGILTIVTSRPDVAVVFSPPLPLPWLVCEWGKARRVPVVVNIQDLFPREAVQLGMLNSPSLIGLFERMERRIYRIASGVTVHSPGNKEHVVQQGGCPEKAHIVYNWINTERIRPGIRDNDFAKENGLTNRFVVSYVGTMGWAQDMGTIIACAERLRNRPDILFLMVGDGVERGVAQARCMELRLKNILWLPMQPWAIYPDVLAASDVSLINLHPQLRTPVVPSKLLSIMAVARPVVASLPLESDARRIIAESGCGFSVDAGDDRALADVILKLHSERVLASEMGRRGRSYVEKNFSHEICIARMGSILKQVIGENT